MSTTLKESFIKKTKETRLYQIDKPIIGLTGGIASGKSTASLLLEKQGHFVISADKLVKEAYTQKDVIQNIIRLCPEAVRSGEIQFKILREKVFSNPELKSEVETLIYSKLPALFAKKAQSAQANTIIYDVPLLFEKGLDKLVDQKVLVYCSRDIQIQRLKFRDGSSEEVIQNILKAQLNIEEKKSLSDYVISNASGLDELENEVHKFVEIYFAKN